MPKLGVRLKQKLSNLNPVCIATTFPLTSLDRDYRIDLDSESEERVKGTDDGLFVDFVILDSVKFHLKREMIPQLLDVYSLHGRESKNDQISHFQYILENNTETEILYGQSATTEVKHLAKGFDLPDS